MIQKEQYDQHVLKTLSYFEKAKIAITEEEKKKIEVADFNLNRLEEIGLQLLVYVNTDYYCAKEMVLLPYQTCPEHKHADGIDENHHSYRGKQETFRVRYGQCFLYVEGKGSKEEIQARYPATEISVFHEIVLHEGEQYTIQPNTLHWFQAGKEGAIISEFSTKSRDESDIFTDKRIERIPQIKE